MAYVTSLLVLGLAAIAQAWDPLFHKGRELTATCGDPLSFPELKPTITHVPVQDLEWVGADDQTVYAITKTYAKEAGGLWRSKNGGTSFEELTGKLNASMSAAPEPFSVLHIVAQKSDPSNLLIMGTGTYMWTSRDKGETYTPLQNAGGWRGSFIRGLKMHPRQDKWLLMLVKRPNCRFIDQALAECPYDLMLNKDAFSPTPNWINMTANSNGKIAGFVDFDWGASLCPFGDCQDMGDIADDLILATTYARPGDYDQPWDKDVNFVTSTNNFADFTTRARCGNMFEVVGRSIYLAVANTCPTDPDGNERPANVYPRGITLYTSINAGRSFTQACLPVALNQDGYELVETHDGRGAVIIVAYKIDTGMMQLPASSVYTAGPHHALFSLSLTNVYESPLGATTDFTRVEGLPGIYIANQMVPWSTADGNTGSILPGDMMYYYEDSYEYDLDDLTGPPLVETRITFNAGGRWQRVIAPDIISNPACDRCKGQKPCYLHLNGLSSWDNMGSNIPAVYSNPSAPGLVMATGNVAVLGWGLDPANGMCTWLSRDGGVTWADVGEGAYIYEFADWGGVIVMARHPGIAGLMANGVAAEIRFSLDYGACWQTVALEIPLLVDNIRIEPDGQRPRVIVHGRACRNTTREGCGKANITDGLMYTLDVKDLMKAELGDCTEADFERWTVPTVTNTPRCILGRQLDLTRRKQDRICLQGAEYKRSEPKPTPCPCTKQLDTECEYGYTRTNDTCVPVDRNSMPTCPVIESKTYAVSETHRRLVHGDTCQNISAIIPDTDGTGNTKSNGGGDSGGGGGGGGGGASPSHSSSSSSKTGWVVFIVVMVVLLALVVLSGVWWRFRATEEQQDTLRELAGSAGAGVASLWGLMVEKISAIRWRSSGPQVGGEEMGYFQPLGDPGHDVEGRGNIFTLK